MTPLLLIGIAGGTASGKSTLIRKLSEAFGEDITLISHDFYYKAHDNMSYEERCKLNYDHPDAYDTDLMLYHLKELMAGRSITHPVYDFTVHNRSSETVKVEPTKVIGVEGILIFENPEIRNLCDIKIFVDADADVRLIRRIMRDTKKRGRTVDSVVKQYMETVKPMHELFVEPTKKYADVIVPEGGKNAVAVDMIIQHIKSILKEDSNETDCSNSERWKTYRTWRNSK